MADVPEDSTTYPSGITQLELTDAAEGGPGGLANAQATLLGDRTAYTYELAGPAHDLAALEMYGTIL